MDEQTYRYSTSSRVELPSEDGGLLRPGRTTIRWGCCDTEEDVTGQQYVYPLKHYAECKGKKP